MVRKAYIKTYRMIPEAAKLYDFLKFRFNNEILFDDIFNFGVSYIRNNGNVLSFSVKEYEHARAVKGIRASDVIFKALDEISQSNAQLLKAEILEVFIYLYAITHILKKEFDFLVNSKIIEIEFINKNNKTIFK